MNHAIAAMPQVSHQVRKLYNRMTLEEKLAQLVGYWVDQGGNVVAPMQNEMTTSGQGPATLAEKTKHGLGHYTRVYGTRPVDPIERAQWLWNEQRRLKNETRLGIPAIVHEEALTGLAAWKAASFPTPLAWGAAFNPDLVARMGELIGHSMRSLGVHQALSPVLDVARDPRWGRVDECISEDPYLVGTIGTAYVQGMQSTGVHATLKHFLGYSGSQSGRNHAPVSAGPREIADTYQPPFEMAIIDGQVASVMNSYSDIDGVPVAASAHYLTDVLRGKLGFEGVVVADYFSVSFLSVMQGLTNDLGQAGGLALQAGIDVELPNGDAYLAPLATHIRSGAFDERYVERSVLRVLAQKESLGLLDPQAYEDEAPTSVDLDSPAHQQAAYDLAVESVVLLSNDGILPLKLSGENAESQVKKLAVIGPNADSAGALQGCYSFTNHVLAHYPGTAPGIHAPTVLEALRTALSTSLRGQTPPPLVEYTPGCEVDSNDDQQIVSAVELAKNSDVAVVVVGDAAGLFGRGTVGEGNDVESLELPGLQRRLITEVSATGTPVVVVILSGRPYSIPWLLDDESTAANAVLQAFFPGESGGTAVADLLLGQANPSGRLPVSLPRSAGAQPYTYLHPILGGPSDVTSADSTPVRPFGFGLSYTDFSYTDFRLQQTAETGGEFTAHVTVTNTGDRAGSETVQLYGHDRKASVVRPVCQLLAYTKIQLQPGESAEVTFTVPTSRFAFSNLEMERVVEPGEFDIWFGAHASIRSRAHASHATGGVITNEKQSAAAFKEQDLTPRETLTLAGGVHQVKLSDPRIARAHVKHAHVN